jgi:hypothetical protein
LSNKFLLIVDGHESRLGITSINQAKELGYAVIVLPPNCTHFMQPWDRIFGSVKAQYSRLFTAYCGQQEITGPVKISRPTFVGLTATAMHNAFTDKPDLLKDAFTKAGLYPPSLEKILAAAAAVTAPAPVQEGAGVQGGTTGAAPAAVADGAPTRLEQQVAAAQPAARKGSKKRGNVVRAAFITSGLYEQLETARLAEKEAEAAAKQQRKEQRAANAAAKAKRKPRAVKKQARKRSKLVSESSSDDE